MGIWRLSMKVNGDSSSEHEKELPGLIGCLLWRKLRMRMRWATAFINNTWTGNFKITLSAEAIKNNPHFFLKVTDGAKQGDFFFFVRHLNLGKKKTSEKREAEKHGDRSVCDSWHANLCQTLPPGPSLSHQNSEQGIRTHFPGATTTWGGRLVAPSVTLTDGNTRRYREEPGRRWESYSHAERWEPSAEILNPPQFKLDLRSQECRIQLRQDSFWDFFLLSMLYNICFISRSERWEAIYRKVFSTCRSRRECSAWRREGRISSWSLAVSQRGWVRNHLLKGFNNLKTKINISFFLLFQFETTNSLWYSRPSLAALGLFCLCSEDVYR